MEQSQRPRHMDPVSWLLRGRESGRITIAQWPNPPLLLFVVATGVRLALHPRGATAAVAGGVATVGLIVWAVLEVVSGVNPFRRILGLLVLIVQLVALSHR